MEKRTIVAIILSTLVILGYSFFMQKAYNTDTTEVTPVPSPTLSATIEQKTSAISSQSSDLIEHQAVTDMVADGNIVLGNLDFGFSSKNGSIVSVDILTYEETTPYDFIIAVPFLHGDHKIAKFPHQFVDEYSYKGWNITRRIQYAEGYKYDFNVFLKNKSVHPLSYQEDIVLANMLFDKSAYKGPRGSDIRYFEMVVASSDGVKRYNLSKLKKTIVDQPLIFQSSGVRWLCLRDKYYCLVAKPDDMVNEFKLVYNEKSQSLSLIMSPKVISLKPFQQQELNIHAYLGPQKVEFLEDFAQGAGEIINYGFFHGISKVILWGLNKLFLITRNWGVSILLLSALVFAIFSPLLSKSMLSMQQMQKLQPEIQEIRQKYKDNPQQMNVATMELYKKYKVNPIGGCLPLLLQIPIFIGLYQVLYRSVYIKKAGFLWIRDLSLPDRAFQIGRSLPIMGEYINILPLLMGIVMFLQQHFTSSAAADTTMQQQQKIMKIFFPIFLTVLFYNFPAGLVLYWFTNSLLTTILQIRVKQKIKAV